MCIAAIKMENVELPSEKHLRNCETHNQDGMGIALLKKGKTEILIKKDFKDIDVFIKWFYENVKKEDICIIHFRYATHGLKDIGNRHPFPVTKNKELLRKAEVVCQIAMAHNGVISSYGRHTKYSDTQKFILDILSDETIKNNLSSPAVQKLVDNFLGGDRLAILQSNGIVISWGEWVKEGELYYSNEGYKEAKVKYLGFQSNYKWDKKDSVMGAIDYCDGCGEKKWAQYVEIKDSDGIYYMLCKSCRKQYKKGTLKLDDEPVRDWRSVDEAAMSAGRTINKMKMKKEIPSEKPCDSCNEWFEEGELIDYMSSRVCLKCVEDILHYTENKKANEI